MNEVELERRAEVLAKYIGCSAKEVEYHKEFEVFEVSLEYFNVVPKDSDKYSAQDKVFFTEWYYDMHTPEYKTTLDEYEIYSVDIMI